MQKVKVLFVCVHNSARSQMAEAFLNSLAGDVFEAQSAGLIAGNLNPYAVRVMGEVRLDISNNKSKELLDIINRKKQRFDYVITVCDRASAERCPSYPGTKQTLHWPFPDPSKIQGTEQEILVGTRMIRDDIRTQIEEWVKTINDEIGG